MTRKSSIDTARWVQAGREAFKRGEQRIPYMNEEVYEAIRGLTVGGGAADIMAAWTRGWDDANLSDVAVPTSKVLRKIGAIK